ncbi:MAG: PD-(D/E)XK nuclease family protein [Candidatus Methanoculleus thermohydrogenotrophicum]
MCPAILYRRLPGEALDEIIAGFREAAARDPLRTVLIVPTSRLADDIVHRLLAEGTSILGDAVTTLAGFARRVFADHAESESLITGAQSRLIIADILTARAADLPLLVRGDRPGSGVVEELATLFEVLITRKVDYPAALGDLQSAKSAEIAFVLDAYLRFLDEHALVDESTLLARAARWLTEGSRDRTGPVFIYGLYEPVPLERDLIFAIRERAPEFHYVVPWADNPAIFSDDGTWIRPDVVDDGGAPPEEKRRISSLFSGREAWDCDGAIRITQRRDRIDEVRAVAQEVRNLIAGGVPTGDIAVAFPDLPAAMAYVEEVFPDFGIPYVSSRGTALIGSPLVRALLAVIAVPVHGYRREDVIALLNSPYINRGQFPAGAIVDVLSREARITGGADSWDERLAVLAGRLEADITTPGTLEGVRRLRGATLTVIAGVREGLRSLFADLATLGGAKTIAGHLAAYRSLLDRWDCPVMPEVGDPALLLREARDRAMFIQILDTLETTARILPEREVSPAEFLSMLSLLAARMDPGMRQRRHAVRVIGIREIPHLTIPHLFIAGLVEGAMPRLTTRLPLATDLETRRLGTRSRADILREERYYFTAALLAARDRISLSFPATDGGSLTIRSSFIDVVRDAATPGPWGAEVFSASRLAAAAEAGAMIARARFDEAVAILPPATVREMVRRFNIENYHRRGPCDSPYDGVLCDDPDAVAVLTRRFGNDAVYSPTVLEAYADCPFSLYLGDVLSLEPLASPDPDLTARERGSLVHRIAHRFYAGWKRDGHGPLTEENYPEALRRILAIGREEAEQVSLKTPVWAVEKEFLLGSPHAGPGLLERFIENELKLAASPFSPRAFEFAFGLPVGEGAVAAVPIRLGEGADDTILLRGRIDRIDVAPDGAFMIIDYKTGSLHPKLADVMAGKALQLPLYIRAVETLTGLSGAAGAYYILRRGDVRTRLVFWDASWKEHFKVYSGVRNSRVEDVRALVDASLARVRDYLHGIRSGRFPPRQDAGPCPGYCGFTTVCRFDGLREFSSCREGSDGAH